MLESIINKIYLIVKCYIYITFNFLILIYKCIKQQKSFNIDNKKCYLRTKSDFKMIFEGSCDTKDWTSC